MLLHRHARGFTIIELMTVLLIAGVLLVIAAPAFTDMLERRRVEGQANELVTDLGYAKSEAVQRNRNVLVMTGGGGACYTIAVWTAAAPGAPRVGGCNCALGPGAACPAGVGNVPIELKTVALAGGASVTDGVTFEFEPVRGALEPALAASAVVALGPRSYAVAVTAYGRVTPFTP